MTEKTLLPAKKGKRKPKAMKPVPVEAYDDKQMSLFQNVLANAGEEDDLSNAIDFWDSIPRYSISRQKMNDMRSEGGVLPIRTVEFHHRGRHYTAKIRPAQIEVSDANGKSTGESIFYYPSAREELIEHALRKLAVEQHAGFFDRTDYRSGVGFTLHRLRKELIEQGHSMTYTDLVEGLEVLHYSFIDVIDPDSDPDDPSLVSQPYLPALAKVNKKGRASDPEAKWFVQFHGLVTDSINKITYRQFNYQRLMQCSSQLARWLMSQLVLKYTQAAVTNTFEMRYSTIKRDSGLLDGYKLQRQAIAALDAAWQELKELGLHYGVKKSEQRGSRSKLEDVIYTVQPSREFAAEQRAANRRQGDAKNEQFLERNAQYLSIDKSVDR
jgi:hypothetical protein